MDLNLYVDKIKKKSIKFLLLAITSLVVLGVAGESLIAKRIESIYFFLLFACIVTYLIYNTISTMVLDIELCTLIMLRMVVHMLICMIQMVKKLVFVTISSKSCMT